MLYKPKDLRLDAAWHSLVARLNPDAPVQLRAASVMACDGYGWAEFIAHSACTDTQNAGRFFRFSGAWLALFHSFGANDIHQENLIAAADHPVPIDLETILQAGAAGPADPEAGIRSLRSRKGIDRRLGHGSRSPTGLRAIGRHQLSYRRRVL